MKVKIAKENGRVLIAVQRPGEKKPTQVSLSVTDAQALAGLLTTAAMAKSFSIEWEQS